MQKISPTLFIDVMSLPDDWEALVDAGHAVMESHDRNRWLIGDITQRVERRYGDESLKKYADEINCRTSTLYDYHRISAFYAPEFRDLYPALTWSHYREAARLDDIEEALELLEQAQDNDWRIAEMHRQVNERVGKPVPPRKLADVSAKITGFTKAGTLTFALSLDVATDLFIRCGDTVRLVIYDVQP